MHLKEKVSSLQHQVNTLHEENNFLLEAGLSNVKEMSTTFASISQMNKYLSRSPSLVKRIMQENQELLKDNMDKHFELEKMRRLKKENQQLQELVEEKMENLLSQHQKKLGEFGSKIEEYYMETIFYLNKKNLEKEKKVLLNIVENLKAKQEEFERQNREIKKRIRNKELECEMIRMDLKKTKRDLSGLRQEHGLKIRGVVDQLTISIPNDYSFRDKLQRGGRSPMRISEEADDQLELMDQIGMSGSVTRRNSRKRRRGNTQSSVSQKKKKNPRRRRRKNIKKEKKPIILEEDDLDIMNRAGNQQFINDKRTFESMNQ